MEPNNSLCVKTYSLPHDQGAALEPFLWDNLALTNRVLEDIWQGIQWYDRKIKGKAQVRILPILPKSNAFRRELRQKHAAGWQYAVHWVDAAIKTAYSILNSWAKNYKNGNRKARLPVLKRPFVRVKQTLSKLEGESFRVTLKPHEYVYFDLSKRWFSLEGKVGEPVLTPTHLHLPISTPKPEPNGNVIGWDMNLLSTDGWSPATGWIQINTTKLQVTAERLSTKRKRLQKIAAKSKKGKRTAARHKHRQRNKTKQLTHAISNAIIGFGSANAMEELNKSNMMKHKQRNKRKQKDRNRQLAQTNWMTVQQQVAAKGDLHSVDAANTSKTCSRCGWYHKDLRGAKVFACKRCRLVIDRQLNAAINVYLKDEGFRARKAWWDSTVLPSLGFAQTGAERKSADELVRRLDEAVKPQISVSIKQAGKAYVCLQ